MSNLRWLKNLTSKTKPVSEVLRRAAFLRIGSGSSEYLRDRLGAARKYFTRSSQSKFLAADGTAAVMPANASLARVLASHILRDGEIVLLVLRPSLWFILLSSLRFVSAAVVLILLVHWRSVAEHGMVRSLIELGVSAISARLMWATLQWMSRLYVLTDMRILAVAGVFRAEIFDCPLRKVARTRLTRTLPEKITGVGSIEIIPQDDSLPFGQWQTIAQPVMIHEQIMATISRSKQGGNLGE